MALIVGATTFDRLFAGARFAEVDGDLLYAFAKDEVTAAEIEERFALHISIIATEILKREIGIVSRYRLSEQNLRVDEWSVCRG
jgi:hypothetical protein